MIDSSEEFKTNNICVQSNRVRRVISKFVDFPAKSAWSWTHFCFVNVTDEHTDENTDEQAPKSHTRFVCCLETSL